MRESNLALLGNRIRAARRACDLTQQELADQTGLAIKTVQDIEHGVKNPTYETLFALIKRLGISASVLFPSDPVEDESFLHFIGKFQSCTPEHRKILLNALDFLTEQLLALQMERDRRDISDKK